MENGHQPATKADLKAMGERVDPRVEMLRSELQHMHHALMERMDAWESRLLKAVDALAQSIQSRFQTHDEAQATLAERLAIVEQRLMNLERRVIFPNHPPQ